MTQFIDSYPYPAQALIKKVIFSNDTNCLQMWFDLISDEILVYVKNSTTGVYRRQARWFVVSATVLLLF